MLWKKSCTSLAFGIAMGTALVLLMAGGAGAATITVDDSGGADYTSVQAAINAVKNGDIIQVAASAGFDYEYHAHFNGNNLHDGIYQFDYRTLEFNVNLLNGIIVTPDIIYESPRNLSILNIELLSDGTAIALSNQSDNFYEWINTPTVIDGLDISAEIGAINDSLGFSVWRNVRNEMITEQNSTQNISITVFPNTNTSIISEIRIFIYFANSDLFSSKYVENTWDHVPNSWNNDSIRWELTPSENKNYTFSVQYNVTKNTSQSLKYIPEAVVELHYVNIPADYTIDNNNLIVYSPVHGNITIAPENNMTWSSVTKKSLADRKITLESMITINMNASTPTPTPTPPTSVIKGDVSGDGQVTVVDALFIAQYTVGLRTLNSQQLSVADVNADGQVTIVDALFIAQYTVGLRQL